MSGAAGLLYSTVLGGGAQDIGTAVALGAGGIVYVAGTTNSADFPSVSGSYRHPGISDDAFLVRLNPALTDTAALLSAVVFGGGNFDEVAVNGLALDSAGNAYLTGEADSANFPTTPGAFQRSRGGASDTFLAKVAPGPLTLSVNDVSVVEGNAGVKSATITVSLSGISNQTVTVAYASANGTATAGSDYGAVSGTLTFAPGVTQQTVTVAIYGDLLVEANETFYLDLSGATAATIARGRGTATILDDDATRFYVVNDATSDRTFEYAGPGNGLENYAMNGGNTAPRGAASTAAGTTVWVVDANKKVFVYNASGGLLGSWTAGTLNSTAVVEGIATNGTDVWIVDARSDKVFRYANAAGRTSGSQNAASSFALNSGNANPKDLVTDGVNLWVLNDSTADKVFKYTLTGTLVGSWTIAGAGTSPTGITLDPAGGGSLWVVDNGTDRVYQFDNARAATSGFVWPMSSFALTAGNTNPQGIADPPVLSRPSAQATRLSGAFIARITAHDPMGPAASLSTGPQGPAWHARSAHKPHPTSPRNALSAVRLRHDPGTAGSMTPSGPLALRSLLDRARRRF